MEIVSTVLLAIIILNAIWPCMFGMHRWDEPGGHCIDCGNCDELFGEHPRCKAIEERCK